METGVERSSLLMRRMNVRQTSPLWIACSVLSCLVFLDGIERNWMMLVESGTTVEASTVVAFQ